MLDCAVAGRPPAGELVPGSDGAEPEDAGAAPVHADNATITTATTAAASAP